MEGNEKTPIPTYEFEFEDTFDTEERLFAITCFFEDLRHIRGFIGETWESYKEGTLDLQTASFVTNAAIDIARKEEENLTCRLFTPGTRASQKKLVQAFQTRAQTANMMDKETMLEFFMVTPFDDFVYNRPHASIIKFSKSFLYAIRTKDFKVL